MRTISVALKMATLHNRGSMRYQGCRKAHPPDRPGRSSYSRDILRTCSYDRDMKCRNLQYNCLKKGGTRYHNHLPRPRGPLGVR
jgi:hypothetical protein